MLYIILPRGKLWRVAVAVFALLFERRNFAELGKASEEGDGVGCYVKPTESKL
ncbi:MAG: hypothetical protein IJV96_03400 [Clostridia bacterium]|nr:hypothetical protein [Clostridia bacterium]